MSKLVTTNSWGETIPMEKRYITDHLWATKQTKDLWATVEEVIKVFQKTQPKKWDSYIIQLEEEKRFAPVEAGLNGKRWRGVHKDRSNTRTRGMTNLHQVDMPIWIMLCLRKLYKEDELSFTGDRGKAFFREFGRRFPLFRIMESV